MSVEKQWTDASGSYRSSVPRAGHQIWLWPDRYGPALRASVLVRNSGEPSELLLVGAMLDSVQSGLPPPPLPHCTDEGTEAQKGEAASPRP